MGAAQPVRTTEILMFPNMGRRLGVHWIARDDAPMSKPETYRFDDDGCFPNSRLPLLVYRQALPAEAGAIERAFAAQGWSNSWRNGVFDYHHFHSSAHEVLGIAAGEVRVAFGGPSGRTVTVRAGDVVVIPAGVAHRNTAQSDDLLVIGAYPGGSDYDLRRGDPREHETVLRAIACVPLPDCDPVFGRDGPLRQLWADQSVADQSGRHDHP